MQSKSPSLVVVKLVLVGRRKDYVIPFSEGVNIVYGDSATGKSSILECINYLLGSSKFVYDREIELSVKFIMMEVLLNGKHHVIKRDIFHPNDPIEVYLTDIAGVDTVFPKKFAPNFGVKEAADGYFSDFLMTALNIPAIKMRQSPSRPDSEMVRLSFRDVFKYCYLKQDDVGSKSLLGGGNYVVESKNKETFKYIFNLLDTKVSDAQEELSALMEKRNNLKRKYDAVSDFLRETQFNSEFDLSDADREFANQEKGLREQLNEVNSAMTADNETYNFLKSTLSELFTSISLAESDMSKSISSVDRYIRLRNDYQNDIDKLKSIRTAQSVIGAPSESFSCPVCDSTVPLSRIKDDFSIDEGDRAGQEVNALVRRLHDLTELVQAEQDKQNHLSARLKSLYEERDRARRLLDEEMAETITPYLSERDGLSAELAKLGERRKQVQHELRVRNQQKLILQEILSLDDNASSMQEKLDALKASAPSLEGVLSAIGDSLHTYLTNVKIKDLRDVSIGKRSFLPILRNRDYRDFTSGGLRTILSIGYFVSVLETAMNTQTNLPTFLMIDTVGKYLGKTKTNASKTNLTEDANEEVTDPSKYLNIYLHMFKVAAQAALTDTRAQIILVDNDVPPQIAAQFGTTIAAHFSSAGANGLAKGLIDDAYLLDQ